MYFILRHCDISCKMMSLIDTGLCVSHTFFSDLYEILVLIGLFMPHNHTLRCTGTIWRLLFLIVGKLRHRSEKCLAQDQMIRCLDIWRTWTWIHPLTLNPGLSSHSWFLTLERLSSILLPCSCMGSSVTWKPHMVEAKVRADRGVSAQDPSLPVRRTLPSPPSWLSRQTSQSTPGPGLSEQEKGVI